MNVTFRDLLDNIQDLCQNYEVTSIDNGNYKRQANRAFEFVQRQLGLPCDIETYSFYFYEDQTHYNCPVDFNEARQIYYSEKELNTADKRWNVAKDTELNRSTGIYNKSNVFSVTSTDGAAQLMLLGSNSIPRGTINSFDSLSGLTFSADVTANSIDTVVKSEGNGSLKLNLDASLSATTITYTYNIDISELINKRTVVRTKVFLPTGTNAYFSNFEIRFISSTGNYYTTNVTTQYDGSAFAENDWSQLSFALFGMTEVGTPVANSITSIQIILNHSGTFSAFNSFRIDNLYRITPDLLVLNYYSSYKGTNAAGTKIMTLSEDTDVLSFGTLAPDLIDAISIRAAMKLFPQIRGDITFWQLYKAEYTEVIKTLSRTYPRSRITGLGGKTEILR